jgi:Domain of Unknown Function with PDB structure (DUF3857)
MMKKVFCSITFILIYVAVNAQLKFYPTFTIPDSLKKDADVVVRDEYIKFTIKDINTAKFEVHEVYTILNEDAKHLLNFQAYSDKFNYLDEAEIIVYDMFGKKLNTYTKKEMITERYGSELVDDGKLTHFSVNAPSYPITIEVNYTTKYKGLFVYPTNYFQNPYHSIQNEVFEVEVPKELSLRYKILNCNYQPVIRHEGDKDFYRWELKNIPAYIVEKHVGSSDNFSPKVLLGPNKFQLDNYEGDMSSWKNFGTWINNLYSTTISLPEERKNFYQTMVKNTTTNFEKAKILYNYMQNNMRYVSIQLGIGGLQPFKASFVDEKKYGDCKALSNYLKSALDAVGIKSNVVIIQGGMVPRNVQEDFPASYFNHVILCIPQPKDTIWLECTSNTLPFAQLGPFTENRKAMLVTNNGGVLVNTPKSNYKNNSTSFFTKIQMSAEGSGNATTTYQLIGEEKDNMLHYFNDAKDDEKKKYFITGMQWKQPDVFDITTINQSENPYIINVKMEYEKIYSFKAGNKYFIEPRLYTMFNEDIPNTEKRNRDYYFDYPYQTTDTTVYVLPSGFSVENLPKNKNINHSFAAYNCTYTWDATSLTFTTIASLQIKERIVKANDYKNLLNFKNEVIADLQEKIVVKKQ